MAKNTLEILSSERERDKEPFYPSPPSIYLKRKVKIHPVKYLEISFTTFGNNAERIHPKILCGGAVFTVDNSIQNV